MLEGLFSVTKARGHELATVAHTPVITEIRRQKQEGQEIKTSLSCRLGLETETV